MSNCDLEFRQAQIASIPFEIQSATHELENERINVVEFPLTDSHYNQKMGSSPVQFSISGLIHGVNARDLYQLAENTWVRGLDTTLFYPGSNKTYNVTVLSCSFRDDGRTLNAFQFSIDLIETANDPYPGSFIEGFLNSRSSSSRFSIAISNFYENSETSLSDFNDSKGQLSTDTRAFLSGDDYVSSTTAINGLTYSSVAKTDTVNAVVDAISRGAASLPFLKSASTPRGENVDELAFSLSALNQYFLTLVEGSICWGELSKFRNHANLLKRSVTDQAILDSIDDLINQAYENSENVEVGVIEGVHHALALSNQIYGTIDRASEIVELSNAVSGAAIVNPKFYVM